MVSENYYCESYIDFSRFCFNICSSYDILSRLLLTELPLIDPVLLLLHIDTHLYLCVQLCSWYPIHSILYIVHWWALGRTIWVAISRLMIEYSAFAHLFPPPTLRSYVVLNIIKLFPSIHKLSIWKNWCIWKTHGAQARAKCRLFICV